MLLFIRKLLMQSIYLPLLLFVLLVNAQIIYADLIYPEQPYIYVANASIHSLADFFNIYLHPKVLNTFNVPFFRPSGHFLIYQLVTPLLGWHNTQALIVINLMFLALTGFGMVKVYRLLFPHFQYGGYVAFSIYLMHPALILSRVIVLHFEFAYTAFAMLSLYYFIRFCQRNSVLQRREPYQQSSLLLLSLLFFIIAVTFKEAALMLGGVLMMYFGLHFYQRWWRSKQAIYLLLLLFTVSVTLMVYISLAWPTFSHPSNGSFSNQQRVAAAIELMNYIFGSIYASSYREIFASPQFIWRDCIAPFVTRFILVAFSLLAMAAAVSVFRQRENADKKSVLFLLLAALLFLLLPIAWGMGMPWHLSPTLIFASLLMGFAVEHFCQPYFKNRKGILIILAILIGLTTLLVNKANLQNIYKKQGLANQLAYNALHSPPVLNRALNEDSIIVIEDTLHINNSYLLGNSYDKALLDHANFDYLTKITQFSHLQVSPLYGGTLFQWGYLQTPLKEDVELGTLDELSELSDKRIYVYLRHYDNIFYFTYDANANWHDSTEAFKVKLLQEKAQRGLTVNAYHETPTAVLTSPVIYALTLGFPDHQLCQYRCDQDKTCKAFTYFYQQVAAVNIMKCLFFGDAKTENKKFCPGCQTYIKEQG